MIHFNVTDWHSILPEMKEHIHAHNDEVGQFGLELDPNYDAYEALADVDKLLVFEARGQADELVGYALYHRFHHMYYHTLDMAASDLIYMAPEYRGEDSLAFIQFCEDELYKAGVDAINISMHVNKDFSGMLEHLGYDKTAIVCSKLIGEH